jgi:hypothetical protein
MEWNAFGVQGKLPWGSNRARCNLAVVNHTGGASGTGRVGIESRALKLGSSSSALAAVRGIACRRRDRLPVITFHRTLQVKGADESQVGYIIVR